MTGGVGMQLGLAALGRQGSRRKSQISTCRSLHRSHRAKRGRAVSGSHYHVVKPGVPKFMIQLVDPASRIRIDVFPDLVGSLADARTIAIGAHAILVLPLERIFEHKVLTLSRASLSAPIDPKHVRDAHVLGEVLGRPPPVWLSECWRLTSMASSRLVLRAL